MKLNEKFPRLEQFFGCYFHQDWMAEYKNEEMAVKGYVHDVGSTEASHMLQDLEHLMALDLSEKELGKVLVEDLQCDYNPDPDGISMRDWLRWVRSTLIKYIQSKQD